MLVFFIFSVLAIFGATGLILFRNPVHNVLSLLLTFFSMAVIYVLLEAPVLAVFQVAVYAGAIMVLFIFVVMFLNLEEEAAYLPIERRRLMGVLLGSLLALTLVAAALLRLPTHYGQAMPLEQAKRLGELLLTRHVVPFELISLLLIGAAIGAVALNRKSAEP